MRRRGFTLIELMVVLMVVGISLMALTPRITARSIGQDPTLSFFNNLMAEELKRARELSMPITITGFKGSANILTYDKESKSIPNIREVSEAKVNRYLTHGNLYAVRIYPDGICDHFELRLNDGRIIESEPLLMKTHFKENGDF